jgi:hypothetical protein
MKNVDYPITKAVWLRRDQVGLEQKTVPDGDLRDDLIRKRSDQGCAAGMRSRKVQQGCSTSNLRAHRSTW